MKRVSLFIIVSLVLATFCSHLSARTIEDYYLKAALLYFDQKESRAALVMLKKALKIDPSHGPSCRLYEHISREIGDIIPSSKPEKQASRRDKTPQKVSNNKKTSSKVVKKEVAKNEVVKEEVVKKEVVEKEEIKEEVAKEEVVKNEGTKEEVVKEERVEKENELAAEMPIRETLKLYNCLRMALDRDKRLLRQEHEIQISRYRADEVKARRWPSMNLNLSYAPASEELEPGGPWVDLVEDYNAFLSLSYEIYPAAIRSIRPREAEANTSIEEERRLEIRRTVLDDVSADFFRILEQEASIRITRDTISKIDEHLKNLKKLHNLGSIPIIEVLRAEDELGILERELRDTQLEIGITRLRLSRLIGYGLDRGIKLSDPQIGPEEIGSLKDCIEQALRERPELKRLKSGLSAARYAKKAAEVARHPTLSLSADYGYIGETFPPDREAARATLLLSIPLFDGGSRRARIIQQKEVVSQREIEIDEIKERIEEEVEAAYTRFRDSSDRLEILKREIEKMERELSLIKKRYEVGRGTYLDVISALRSLDGARKRLMATEYSVKLLKLRLIQVMGLNPVEYVR